MAFMENAISLTKTERMELTKQASSRTGRAELGEGCLAEQADEQAGQQNDESAAQPACDPDGMARCLTMHHVFSSHLLGAMAATSLLMLSVCRVKWQRFPW